MIAFTGILFLSLASFFVQNNVSAESDVNKNIFEMGERSIPLLLTNIILIGLLILHYQKNLPNSILQFFYSVRDFEVSKRVTVVIILVLLGLYIIFSVPELSELEIGPDVKVVRDITESFSIKDSLTGVIEGPISPLVRFTLLSSSLIIFDNIRYVPLIVSVSLLLVTFLLTYTLSKKRLGGIIAMNIKLKIIA